MRAASVRLLQTLVAVATAATTTSARAEDGGGYIIPGFLATPTLGHASAVGWGGELSFMGYSSSSSEFGLGAFGQIQSYVGSAPTHSRYAAGVQAGWMIGGELGIAVRQGAGQYTTTTGVQFGPYISMGVIEIGTRFVLPISHDPAGESYGFEAGLDLAIKLPIPFGKPPPSLSFGHGRPLRVTEEDRVAALTTTSSWSEPSV